MFVVELLRTGSLDRGIFMNQDFLKTFFSEHLENL
jgi:hypothetical protein